MRGADELLSAAEVTALREAIATAVLNSPAGMSTALQDDPQAYLRLVAATRTAAEETSRLLREAVDGARHAGHSWDSVGQLLGVSRQAAQQRFGTPANTVANKPVAGAPARRVLSPLTAFDEMDVLAEEGRHGWHSVDYGTLFHLVEASPWQWEHRRVLVLIGPGRRRLHDEGWQLIGSMWFPWVYYKRRLDIPAEPD
ncbi:MAG TPA: hypothetical protein VFE45_11230 [Coriobacteriia bacterium]|nr:hypothetical protein [Coriobacteriia bacterium]